MDTYGMITFVQLSWIARGAFQLIAISGRCTGRPGSISLSWNRHLWLTRRLPELVQLEDVPKKRRPSWINQGRRCCFVSTSNCMLESGGAVLLEDFRAVGSRWKTYEFSQSAGKISPGGAGAICRRCFSARSFALENVRHGSAQHGKSMAFKTNHLNHDSFMIRMWKPGVPGLHTQTQVVLHKAFVFSAKCESEHGW